MANSRAEAVAALEARLGHAFQDRALLEQALTHPSVGEGGERQAAPDYNRLEFLGDRVLGLLTAEKLMADYPEANEGQLSSRLHALVDKPACARVAERLDIGPALRLSPGETKQGGRLRQNALGDAVEAVLAAVYLDGGLDPSRRLYLDAWSEEFLAPPARADANPKSALQEWALSLALPLPTYEIVERTGLDHAPTFTVVVRVEGVEPETGRGRSRQDAEKAAARGLLKREGVT